MVYWKFWSFIKLRALAELKADVRTSQLGIAWWVLDPLIYMGVFYLVFALGLRQGKDGFVAFLMVGLVTWRWFDMAVKKAGTSLMAYRTLISQIYLPKIILPAIPIISNSIKFLMVFSLLLIILSLSGYLKYSSLYWLPAIIIVQLIHIVGLGFLLAAVIPFAVDIKRLVDYGLSLLFFMSGIFYYIRELSDKAYFAFMINPMGFFIESYRLVMLDGKAPDINFLVLHLLSSVLLLMIAVFLFNKFDKRYPLVI